MFVSKGTLKDILEKNVCEIKFLRKRPNKSLYRRMLCTRDMKDLLDTPNGYKSLNFKKPPASPMKRFGMTYNWQTYPNLLMVWDIFMCDWRVINVQNCDLIWTIPADNNFWDYFNKVLIKMTPAQKTSFMLS